MLEISGRDSSATTVQLPAAPDFRLLFEAAPGLYLVLTRDFTIAAVSEAYLRATMTDRAEILGRRLFEVFPDNPDDPGATGVANLRDSLQRVIDSGHPDAMAVQKYDIRRPESEGGGFEERYWSPVNLPVFGADGEIAYIIHRVEDVTDFVWLKQQGSAQAKLTDELRVRTEEMEKEIYRRAQEIQETNRQLRQLHDELELRVRERTSELQRANEELHAEMVERRKTQEALLQSEDQLRQSQKLEAVGRLAGGVAHDFNNLLSVILSCSELLLAELGPGDACRDRIEDVRKAGERAAELTRQLLAFSRQQVLDPKILDLNAVLNGVNNMLTRVLGEDVELRMSLTPQLGSVRADRGQLEQVVMNLVVNARDAMPDGGQLTIETMEVELGERYADEQPGVDPGPHVVLAVRDTGIGMDLVTQARIFEPFFTTKERGKGTGLGLSTVFGIVKQSGGSIGVYSEPGAGTTFKIYLPRAEGPAEPAVSVPHVALVHCGNETILLVEDEDQVRQVARRILQQAGYHVVEAKTPAEALLICEQHPLRIHVLLSDVVMPKMNGRLLAERVGPLRPEMKIVFMSGYTDDVILQHGVLGSGAAYVQKPFTPQALTGKIREVLDA